MALKASHMQSSAPTHSTRTDVLPSGLGVQAPTGPAAPGTRTAEPPLSKWKTL